MRSAIELIRSILDNYRGNDRVTDGLRTSDITGKRARNRQLSPCVCVLAKRMRISCVPTAYNSVPEAGHGTTNGGDHGGPEYARIVVALLVNDNLYS